MTHCSQRTMLVVILFHSFTIAIIIFHCCPIVIRILSIIIPISSMILRDCPLINHCYPLSYPIIIRKKSPSLSFFFVEKLIIIIWKAMFIIVIPSLSHLYVYPFLSSKLSMAALPTQVSASSMVSWQIGLPQISSARARKKR